MTSRSARLGQADKETKRREERGHEVWQVGWEESCRPHEGTRRRSAVPHAHPAYRHPTLASQEVGFPAHHSPAVNEARQPIHTSRPLPADRPVARVAVSSSPAAPALIGCTHQHQLNKSGVQSMGLASPPLRAKLAETPAAHKKEEPPPRTDDAVPFSPLDEGRG